MEVNSLGMKYFEPEQGLHSVQEPKEGHTKSLQLLCSFSGFLQGLSEFLVDGKPHCL